MPFSYPDAPRVRRHGPSGYATYKSYLPWLRDEFIFRCVYCLKREQWGIVRASYNIDHYLPQANYSKAVLNYDNLLYACATCNSAKRDRIVPDPCECMLGDQVILHENGGIEGTSREARKLINLLGLDDAEYCEFRRMWIGIVAMARKNNYGLFQQLMKYPDNLPDLSRLRPRDNSRLEGIEQSCRARRDRDQLPETY